MHLRDAASVGTASIPVDRSTAHPIVQVKHSVAGNHHVRILQQVLGVDRAGVALAGPEHDGYDVHAHLVDQARGEHLPADVGVLARLGVGAAGIRNGAPRLTMSSAAGAGGRVSRAYGGAPAR